MLAAMGLLGLQTLATAMASIVSAKPVALVQDWKQGERNEAEATFFLLNSRAQVVGKVIGPMILDSIKISDDGTLAVTRDQRYDRVKNENQTDFEVADQNGHVASLHLEGVWNAAWMGHDLLLFGGDQTFRWLIRQSELKEIAHSTLGLLVDGRSFWLQRSSEEAGKRSFLAKISGSKETERFESDANHDILAAPSGTPYIFSTARRAMAGFGMDEDLLIGNRTTGKEVRVTERFVPYGHAWFAKLGRFAYIEWLPEGSDGYATLISPANLKKKRLGPKLGIASLAKLDEDSFLLCGSENGGEYNGGNAPRSLFVVNPNTGQLRRLIIPGTDHPMFATACRSINLSPK